MLSVAATALSVKTVLAGPIAPVADRPLHDLGHAVGKAVTTATARSGPALDGAASHVVAAIARIPEGRPDQPKSPTAWRTPTSLPSTLPAQRDAIHPGVSLDAPRRLDRSYSRPLIKRILRDAARRHGVDPKLVLAISYWESGWDQSRVSETGAIGLMQVEPYVADGAGPSLLGRPVDITDPYDNADLGVAIFKEDLDRFGDPGMALAAYNQGPDSLKQNGILPETQAYVEGITALAATIDS